MNLWLTQAKSGRMHNHTTQKSDSYVKLTQAARKKMFRWTEQACPQNSLTFLS